MKVFVSWSGDSAGAIANALREFLAAVLAERVEPFVSSEDIGKGQRGLAVIAEELRATDFGIVVLTEGNQHSPWINFESGALGKSVTGGRVIPLLVGLRQTDVTGPLAQFQMVTASNRADVLHMISNVNGALAEPLPAATYEVLFREYWPGLEAAIAAAQQDGAPTPPRRETGDMLEEILLRLRSLDRQFAVSGMNDFYDYKEDPLKIEIMALLARLEVAYTLNETREDGNLLLEIGCVNEVPLPREAFEAIRALATSDVAHVSQISDETGIRAIRIRIFDQ
jgi:hypothetical protein